MRATGPFIALAWIASSLLGATAMLVLAAQAAGMFASPLGIALFSAGTLGGAALLLFPPLWRAVTSLWLNIPRVIVAILLIYAGAIALPNTAPAAPGQSRAAP